MTQQMLSNVFVTCKMANRTEIECPTQIKKKVNGSNEKLMNPGSYLQGHIQSRLSQFLPNTRQRSRQLQKLPIVFTKCNNIETIGKFQFDSQLRWNWDQSEEINGRLPTSATSVASVAKKNRISTTFKGQSLFYTHVLLLQTLSDDGNKMSSPDLPSVYTKRTNGFIHILMLSTFWSEKMYTVRVIINERGNQIDSKLPLKLTTGLIGNWYSIWVAQSLRLLDKV